MKRIMALIIAILMLTTLYGCNKSGSGSKISNEEIRAVANNLQNGGQITSDDEWIYYPEFNYGGGDALKGIHKIQLENGLNDTFVSDTNSWGMFHLGNKLFYNDSGSGYYYLVDGNDDPINLNMSPYLLDACFQTDGQYYYVNNTDFLPTDAVYKVELENPENYTKIFDANPTKLVLHGEYLYVMSSFGKVNNEPNSYFGTWRIDLDGSNPIKLLDFCPNYLIVSEDKLYYTDTNDILCSMNLDGSNYYQYGGINPYWGLNISDEYIFYIDYEISVIHRMSKDGTNDIVLSPNLNRCSSLYILGDWLVYIDEDDSCVYRMSFDGTIISPITDPVPKTAGFKEETALPPSDN